MHCDILPNDGTQRLYPMTEPDCTCSHCTPYLPAKSEENLALQCSLYMFPHTLLLFFPSPAPCAAAAVCQVHLPLTVPSVFSCCTSALPHPFCPPQTRKCSLLSLQQVQMKPPAPSFLSPSPPEMR